MMEKRKIEAIVTKHQKVKRRISLSSKEKGNYENDTRNKTDISQTSNNKNPCNSKKRAKKKYKQLVKWFISYEL